MGIFNNISPPRLLIFTFMSLIATGTVLLMLPFATTTPITFVDALFTATSAATVTGLSVVDTASTFTWFGEFVILALIQLGGIGVMTFAMIILMILGRKIGFKDRILMQEAWNQDENGGIVKLIREIFIITFAIEITGAILLSFRFIPEYGLQDGIWYSIFHAVSAFNNAGFALFSDNLMSYVSDPLVSLTICGLIILGGLGFVVIMDVLRKRKFKKLALHSKITIMGTSVLLAVSTAVFFILEYANPATLGGLKTTWEKMLAAFFQAVTCRTAGFNTIDIGAMTEASQLFSMFLMFIGGGSASTAGGIKITTFAVITFGVLMVARSRNNIVIYDRRISETILIRALAITVISVMVIFSVTFLLTLTESIDFLPLLFEVVSAFGTVGLSMGITATLTPIGKLLITFMMFFGKLGPLTFIFSLTKRDQDPINYPTEAVITG